MNAVKKGDRIRLVRMTDDPRPVKPGTLGTVGFVSQVDFGRGDRFLQVGVRWDDGRSLMLCTPPDSFEVVSP